MLHFTDEPRPPSDLARTTVSSLHLRQSQNHRSSPVHHSDHNRTTASLLSTKIPVKLSTKTRPDDNTIYLKATKAQSADLRVYFKYFDEYKCRTYSKDKLDEVK
ncbi:hypothetical protein P8452_42773 [Trifolium repens]|nr:hypothetical protein P8452_42773 [Trifolium repens]